MVVAQRASVTRSLRLVLAALAFASGCARDREEGFAAPPGPSAQGPVVVHEPASLSSVPSGERDALGREVRVACVTCHSLRDGGAFPKSAGDLREFHAGLVVRHGTLACTSCHENRAGGEPRLHLATGESVPTRDAMRLCGQCHGPKLREYEAGRHGGMTGHWDLSRGGRTRNHCVDCHDPHVPLFQPSVPVLRPNDRFLTPASSGGSHG